MAKQLREEIGKHKVVDGQPSVMSTGKPEGVGNLTVKLDLDASDVISGLKAIQREAKEATRALREMEAQKTGYIYGIDYAKDALLERMSTKALSEELARREGVTEYVIDPHKTRAVIEFFGEVGSAKVDVEGPARIIVNKD